MKKIFSRISAVVFAVILTAVAPLTAFTKESNYTYNYDYWGEVQESPDLYSVCRVFTSTDLGLDVKLNNPSGLFAYGNLIYICDTGNNRIIELERSSLEKLEVKRIIDSFQGAENNTFKSPTDFAISEDGNYFVCDNGNGRILKLDPNFNYLMEFNKPVDNTLDEKLEFQPTKMVIDSAERVYCIATGINKGLVKYESDGTFSGFVGATPVTYDWTDYIWKKLATQEQLEKMESFVPTEYSNIYMDYEGFIYGVISGADEEALDDGSADAVRKLNLMGNNILVKNGDWYPVGDLYWGNGGGHEGPSVFVDVTVMTNDVYVCLDNNRGRLFAYDDQGHMVFTFGGNGNMDGYFRRPSAIEHIGHDLFVLDSLDCSLTMFIPTEFGKTVYDAIEQFDAGDYEASGKSWESVMSQNGNYDLAYIGIGRSLLRQRRFEEAMKYFEVKYDDENYSKAYKQYRKQYVEDHIGIIVAILAVVIIVPLVIGRVRHIKMEIALAEKEKIDLSK